jgi:uncharacterized protein (TIGR03032 family)
VANGNLQPTDSNPRCATRARWPAAAGELAAGFAMDYRARRAGGIRRTRFSWQPRDRIMTTPPPDSESQIIQCSMSDGFQHWLSQVRGTLALTTYQAGKVAFVGWDGRQAMVLLRQFQKPMGMAVQGPRIALATQHEITLFANAPLLAPDYIEEQRGRYDALYLPRATYHTGDLNVHDLAFGSETLWLVNTRFSCLAALSKDFSFAPLWKPPFISEIVPEDRCHLNGLALVDGRPKYVTALGESDTVGGWRAAKADGGIVIDVPSGEIIVRGLSMPHSPRWHDGHLWVLNSGAGELWQVDPQRGTHQVVCTLPAYLRGLCLVGPFALIGMCQIRERHIFGGLPVQQRCPNLKCGVAILDLRTGETLGTLEFTSGCQELYEVQFLAGITRPMILNLDKPEVRQAFTAPEFSYWLRPSSQIPTPGEN